jgi:MFS family permease
MSYGEDNPLFNIIMLGLVSFFADISSEMVYPLIPLYLTGAFGATPALVGVIEGIAESTASLLKVYSGYLTDRYSRKKPIAFIGYAAGLVYKAALLLSSSWGGVLAARVIDRLGKGIRTSPRDVMVSESADRGRWARPSASTRRWTWRAPPWASCWPSCW